MDSQESKEITDVLRRAAELRKQQDNDSEDLAGGHGLLDADRNRFLTGAECRENRADASFIAPC